VPEENKVAMGRTWKEYGLTEEGAYRMLYFREKNNQMRNFQATQRTLPAPN
jgi:hypothetical protein